MSPIDDRGVPVAWTALTFASKGIANDIAWGVACTSGARRLSPIGPTHETTGRRRKHIALPA